MADSVDASPKKGVSSTTVAVDNVNASFSGLTMDTGNKCDESNYRYRMDHKRRGKFIIINNKTFNANTKMKERKGTDVDAKNLSDDFERLGFEVKCHHNLKTMDMLMLMIQAAKEDHSDCDCFGVAVLSHGEKDYLYGVDGTIAIDKFVQPIKSCKSLAGKPKIFIFQACRGNEVDAGTDAKDDDTDDYATAKPAKYVRIPLEADFIYAYSTVPGYYSWRNGANGSWFVQALHKMLPIYQYSLDFARLLTRVSHEVAREFESNTQESWMNGKKQVPSVVSMLTKDIYFNEKK